MYERMLLTATLELESHLEKADRSRKVAGSHPTKVNELATQVPCKFRGLYENSILIAKVVTLRFVRWT